MSRFPVLFGGICLSLLVLAALFAPWLATADPTTMDLPNRLLGPGPGHLLGQDALGRDIFSRILYGSRVSLYVGVVTVTVSVLLGTLIGAIAGYRGGWVDEALMRLVDVFLAFPGILLAIALTAVLGPSLNNVVLALCIMGWVGYARIVRGQVLLARELSWVEAARATGCSARRVLLRHILPNVMAPVLVEATFGMAGAIVAEAGLSFLGLGTQPPTPSWGAMLAEGSDYILFSSHLTIWPGVAILLTVLGINLLGDALRDRMQGTGRGGVLNNNAT
ncbi:MAG: ABC transporter permease [Nitrospirota bacterium]|nr:ABC transporter permease [Nitrospirota bacterium]